MGNEKQEENGKDTVVDNSNLEEMIKQEITPQMQEEVFEILKDSRLLVPVSFVEEDESEDSSKGFGINYVEEEDDIIVPLFTSSEMVGEAEIDSAIMAIDTSDLAELIRKTDGFSMVSINPFTDYDLNMPVDVFLNLFYPDESFKQSLSTVSELLKEKSIELDKDCVFYLRSDDDFMKKDAVDGVFTPKLPFNVSSQKYFKEDCEFLNILIMPKSMHVLFVGKIVSDDFFDIIIAPETRFDYLDDLDEFTRVWKCSAQPFYD